jgi:hypothetical protein
VARADCIVGTEQESVLVASCRSADPDRRFRHVTPESTAVHSGSLPWSLVLQRQLGGRGRLILVERGEDLRPDAGLAPAMLAAVYRLPGTEVRREIAPGGSGARHPEHTGEHGARVVRRTTRGRLLGREERSDARPPRIGQVRGGIPKDLDRERARWVGMLAGAARRLAAPGDRLVPAPEGGPAEAEGTAFGWLGERQQQAADFRHGEGEQRGTPPFSSAVA